MSSRTFQPSDPQAAPFEQLRLQNMNKPKARDASPAPSEAKEGSKRG